MTRNHNEFAVVLKKAIRFVLPKVKPQVRQGNQQLAFSQSYPLYHSLLHSLFGSIFLSFQLAATTINDSPKKTSRANDLSAS